MAANLVRAKARDQTNDQATQHRNRNHRQAQRVGGGRADAVGQGLKEEQVGENPDQVQQQPGRQGTDRTDGRSQRGNGWQPVGRGEVTPFVKRPGLGAGTVGMGCHASV